jgi:hypothetical protein
VFRHHDLKIKLTIPGFPKLLKKHWSSIGLEIRPQSAFTALDSNGRLAHFFFNLKRAKQPL